MNSKKLSRLKNQYFFAFVCIIIGCCYNVGDFLFSLLFDPIIEESFPLRKHKFTITLKKRLFKSMKNSLIESYKNSEIVSQFIVDENNKTDFKS